MKNKSLYPPSTLTDFNVIKKGMEHEFYLNIGLLRNLGRKQKYKRVRKSHLNLRLDDFGGGESFLVGEGEMGRF